MIDLDREEFLQRLDLRLATISSMLAYHEKFIADIHLKKDKYREVEKYINTAQNDFLNHIVNTDKEISKRFLRIKAELAKENGENEQNTGNVRIYFPMNGKERCFGSTDESYKLVLHLLLDCGYKIKSEINSPNSWLTKKIYLEYAEKLGVEL